MAIVGRVPLKPDTSSIERRAEPFSGSASELAKPQGVLPYNLRIGTGLANGNSG
jgi:hypothetical protein